MEVSGYISFDVFIRKLLLKKRVGNEMYNKYMQVIADGFQGLGMNHGGVLKSVEVDVNQATGTVTYPADYVDYVSLSIEDNGKMWTFTKDNKIVITED